MRWSTLSLAIVCTALATLGFFLGRPGNNLHTGSDSLPRALTPNAAPSAPAASNRISEEKPAPATSSLLSWEHRWQDSIGESNTPARNRKLAALLRELA